MTVPPAVKISRATQSDVVIFFDVTLIIFISLAGTPLARTQGRSKSGDILVSLLKNGKT